MIKHNKILQRLYIESFSLIFRIIGKFVKHNSKQVFFQSLIGRNYGDSPKIIYDSMLKDPFFKDYKFVWAFLEPEQFQVYEAEKVKLNSLWYFIKALQSGVWVCNVNVERGLLFKPNKTVFLNTGHGGQFKLDGNAQKNRSDYDYSDVDMFCCFSEFDREIVIRDYKVRRESTVVSGIPRDDELYTVGNEDVQEARKKFGIPNNKKVILYAPTWRDSSDLGTSYVLAPPINIKLWQDRLGDDYVLLLRTHPLTTELMGIEFNEFVIDASKEQNVNIALIASDILITDYSSIAYDYAILERPIIAFAYDYEAYINNRGLNEKLEVMFPGSVFSNEEQVIEHIANMDFKNERLKTQKIKDKYVQARGNATKVCMDFLKSKINENNREQ